MRFSAISKIKFYFSLIQFKKNINSAYECSNTIDPSEIENYFSDLELLKKLNPNLKYNFELTYDYYRALIFYNVVKNTDESISLLMDIIERDCGFMRASFCLWKILKKKNLQLLLKYSLFILKISHSEEVTYSEWVKSYLLLSKSLFYNKKYEQSIQVLISLLSCFTILPNENIKFLSKINKVNQISFTNVFENFESALAIFSKANIYKKCQEIFEESEVEQDLSSSLKELELFIDSKSISSINFNLNCNIFFILDITVISDPSILYQIGKICAKSKTKLELGLMCLDDYILILKSQNNYKLSNFQEKKKLKAKFWKGVIFTMLKNYK